MADETLSRITQDEILQMAVQVEELGRDFYEALAGATCDPRVLQLCHHLAAEEDKHGGVFRRLPDDLAAQDLSILLTDEQVAAWRRLKDRILPTSDTIYQIACGGNILDALNLAVKMEARTIRFYTRFAEALPPGNAVEAIIAEERTHLRLLTAVRCGLEAAR